jgi:hypothetical protein
MLILSFGFLYVQMWDLARRCQFDDPGDGPLHAPLTGARAYFEDIFHRLEAVLQGMPMGMWSCI